jgi:tRNA(fMet)-specific endonuclease VapC
MKAIDTDLLTEILLGNAAYLGRLATIPVDEQAAPIVAIEEILRGRLNKIRQAEAGKRRIAIDRAYQLLEETLAAIRHVKFVSFTTQAEALLKDWRKQKIKGSTHDLRIAASCVANSATLVTRNRRDFEKIPGLSVEFWD